MAEAVAAACWFYCWGCPCCPCLVTQKADVEFWAAVAGQSWSLSHSCPIEPHAVSQDKPCTGSTYVSRATLGYYTQRSCPLHSPPVENKIPMPTTGTQKLHCQWEMGFLRSMPASLSPTFYTDIHNLCFHFLLLNQFLDITQKGHSPTCLGTVLCSRPKHCQCSWNMSAYWYQEYIDST